MSMSNWMLLYRPLMYMQLTKLDNFIRPTLRKAVPHAQRRCHTSKDPLPTAANPLPEIPNTGSHDAMSQEHDTHDSQVSGLLLCSFMYRQGSILLLEHTPVMVATHHFTTYCVCMDPAIPCCVDTLVHIILDTRHYAM
jgi:hypothetical protein